MQADMCRYVTEANPEKDVYYRFFNKANLLYNKGMKIKLADDNIQKLSLVNNFATFLFEVKNDTSQAINLIEDALN